MKAFTKGLRAGIPIGLGYLSVSIGFGLLAVNGGLTIGQAVIISLTNLTSAGQLAGVGVIFSMGSLLEMAATQLVINIRYALMSIAISQKMEKAAKTPYRLGIAFFITDEIFAVSASEPGRLTKPFLFGLSVIPYIGWALGTWIGAVAGAALPGAIRDGMGILLYGMFLAIVIPPARKRAPIRMAVMISAVCSCALRWLPILNRFPGGFSIILCAMAASCYCAVRYPIKEAP